MLLPKDPIGFVDSLKREFLEAGIVVPNDTEENGSSTIMLSDELFNHSYLEDNRHVSGHIENNFTAFWILREDDTNHSNNNLPSQFSLCTLSFTYENCNFELTIYINVTNVINNKVNVELKYGLFLADTPTLRGLSSNSTPIIGRDSNIEDLPEIMEECKRRLVNLNSDRYHLIEYNSSVINYRYLLRNTFENNNVQDRTVGYDGQYGFITYRVHITTDNGTYPAYQETVENIPLSPGEEVEE